MGEKADPAKGETPTMGSGQYIARPEAMRSAAGHVGGLIMQASSMLLALQQQPDVDPGSLGSIGSSVGSADATLHDQQVSALNCVLSLLQGVSSKVEQSADGYQEADAAVAATYSGEPVPAREGPLTWSSPASAALASQAAQDSGTGAITPHRAESIIGYLAEADLGQIGRRGQGGPLSVPVGSAGDLAAWLEDSPDHQAQLGVIAVYAGAARGLDDNPGRLRPGDLVCIEPGGDAADQDVIAGVVGDDGGLYNHGLLSPDFGGLAEVRIYRPIGGGVAGSSPAPPRTGQAR
jgi:uncharacterized protein YukE